MMEGVRCECGHIGPMKRLLAISPNTHLLLADFTDECGFLALREDVEIPAGLSLDNISQRNTRVGVCYAPRKLRAVRNQAKVQTDLRRSGFGLDGETIL